MAESRTMLKNAQLVRHPLRSAMAVCRISYLICDGAIPAGESDNNKESFQLYPMGHLESSSCGATDSADTNLCAIDCAAAVDRCLYREHQNTI